MKSQCLRLAIAVGLVAAMSLPLLANSNDDVTEALFKKISNTVNLAGVTGVNKNSYAVLMYPGLYVPSTLLPDAWSDVRQKNFDAYLLATMANTVPSPSWISNPTTVSVDDVYKTIINNVDTNALPKSEADIKRHEELYNKVYVELIDKENEYTRWDLYTKYQIQYAALYDNIEAQKIIIAETGKGRISAVDQMMLDQARKNWEGKGRKAETEGMIQEMHELDAKNPQVYFQNLKTTYNSQLCQIGNGTTYGAVNFFPAYKEWADFAGWTKVKMDETAMKECRESLKVQAEVKVKTGYFFWKVDTKTNASLTKEHMDLQTKNLSLEFELKRVNISRPWLDGQVFKMGTWSLSKAAGENYKVSFGKEMTPGYAGPLGTMPLVPTAMILARNVKITGAFSAEEQNVLQTSMKNNTSVGWGPFSLGGKVNGNANVDYSKTDKSFTFNGTTIQFAEMQVIGFICEVLPETPVKK